jgi:WD40 repeat protein/energy-coupling factor transporter ATP-binding protein EcfA2
MSTTHQQVQTFQDITITGEGNTFTVNQIIQITASSVQNRSFNPISPYRGLKRFEARDKDLFFGRDQAIASLINAIAKNPLLLILGASGSGKSSLIRAGVLPQLSDRLGSKFRAFIFTPDLDPFKSLESSLIVGGFSQDNARIALQYKPTTLLETVDRLKQSNEQWLVFVDQFEELFTRTSDLEKRKIFIENLVNLVQNCDHSVKLILAMRADFLHRFSPYPKFGKLVEPYIHLVTDMHPDELRLAIEQPAAQHGVIFEGELVKEIVNDVIGQAASLPLLEYTLDLLWQRDDIEDRTLNIKTYRELGGVRGALQKHVNEIYDGLSPDRREAVKCIFLRLVKLDEASKSLKFVSRRAEKSEFNKDEELILKTLVDANLLVSNLEAGDREAAIEIAHETLIHSWDLLQHWITESQELIHLRNRLSEDAKNWQNSQDENKIEAEDELWSGSKLQRVAEVRERGEFKELGGLSEIENQFIDASLQKRDRLLKQQVRRVTFLALGAIASTVLVSIAGLFAQRQSTIAQLGEKAAISRNLLSFEPVDGLLLAIASTGDSQQKLKEVLHPIKFSLLGAIEVAKEKNMIETHQGTIFGVGISENGELVASGGTDGTVKLWNAKGELINEFRGHQFSIYSLAMSADGERIVSGDESGILYFWSRDRKLPIKQFKAHEERINSISMTPDGNTIVTGGGDGTIKLWNRDGQAIAPPMKSSNYDVISVAITADGGTIVSGNVGGSIHLWNRDGKLIQKVASTIQDNYEDMIFAVAISPDGQIIATGGWGGTINLWNREGDRINEPQYGHQSSIYSIAFNPDGTIVSSSIDGTLRLWTSYGQPLGEPFRGHQEMGVNGLAIAADTYTIVSGGGDGTIRIWEGVKTDQIDTESKEETPDSSFDEGETIELKDYGKVRLWQTNGQFNIQELRQEENPETDWIAQITPDGETIITRQISDDTVRLWNRQGEPIGEPLQRYLQRENFQWVARSSDGQAFLTGGWDERTVKLWNENGEMVDRLVLNGSVDNILELWRGDWHKLLEVGCDRLYDSAVFKNPVTPTAENAWNTCQREVWTEKELAQLLVEQGQALAKSGDKEGAKAKFEAAKKRDSEIVFDTDKQINLFLAKGLIEKANTLVKKGEVKAAIAAYEEARTLQPNLEIYADDWHNICFYGSLYGEAQAVIEACDRAVDLSPEDGLIRDSRGIARAIVGDKKGAIADFEAFIGWSLDSNKKEQRQEWIGQLKAGHNPLNPQELNSLVQEHLYGGSGLKFPIGR